MTFIGYARISTEYQNIQNQIDALTEAGCIKVFSETASGAKSDRPQLKACLDYLRPDDTLVVWKLDRLARSLKHLLELMQHFEKNNINFKSITDQIDTTTAIGRFAFHIYGSMVEFERNIISERVKEGMSRSKKRGISSGRKPALNQKQILHAKALYDSNMYTIPEILEELKIRSTATLYKYIKIANNLS